MSVLTAVTTFTGVNGPDNAFTGSHTTCTSFKKKHLCDIRWT